MIKTEKEGIEPSTFGFGNHCSTTELFSFNQTLIRASLEIKNRCGLLLITVTYLAFVLSYYKNFLLILILISNTTLTNEILNYFIFTTITELFLIYILLGFLIVKHFVYFILLYHTICFLAPGMYRTEYANVKFIFLISLVLAIVSNSFFHSILMPIVSKFFLSFQNQMTQSMPFYFEAKISDYLILITEVYASCFFIFQLCILLFILSYYISNNIKLLKIARKIFYLLFLVVSTVITPPDILSQLFLYCFFLIGFELQNFLNIFKKYLIWQKITTN